MQINALVRRTRGWRSYAAGAIAALSAALTVPAPSARAADFFGFDPVTFDGAMLPADTLRKMVSAAMAAKPPKHGSKYVIGFANLSRDIPFTILVEKNLQANAAAANVDLVVADNRLDGPTALSVAQSFAQRDVDFAIEFQLDVNFGPAIMNVFDQAKIPVIAIDIPMPGSTFFGVNNPKAGFMGGSYLASAAVAKWGDKVKSDGYLVIGELTQSGAVLGMRSRGQRAGFKSVVDLPADHILKIDTTATIEQAFSQMNSVMARIPPGSPIMVTANNDQSVIGMIRAATTAGRGEDVVGVGLGADEIETMMKEPRMIAAVGFFPERYGNWLMPLTLAKLAGQEVPPSVLINHVMVTPANVCKFYDKFACDPNVRFAKFDYKFPQSAFEALLAEMRKDPTYKGNEAVIPTN